jgi:hypothetical protein
MTVMTVKHKSTDDEKKTTDRQFRRGKPVQVYLDEDLIDAIHEWTKEQPGRALTQSEAIRRLLDRGLSVSPGKGGKKP